MIYQCPGSGTTRWANGRPIKAVPSDHYDTAECWDCGQRFELELHRRNSDRQVLPFHVPEPKP